MAHARSTETLSGKYDCRAPLTNEEPTAIAGSMCPRASDDADASRTSEIYGLTTDPAFELFRGVEFTGTRGGFYGQQGSLSQSRLAQEARAAKRRATTLFRGVEPPANEGSMCPVEYGGSLPQSDSPITHTQDTSYGKAMLDAMSKPAGQ
eukprot:COSAG03_NODE_3523_length_1970_cov_3.814538_1_plen_150_part_00